MLVKIAKINLLSNVQALHHCARPSKYMKQCLQAYSYGNIQFRLGSINNISEELNSTVFLLPDTHKGSHGPGSVPPKLADYNIKVGQLTELGSGHWVGQSLETLRHLSQPLTITRTHLRSRGWNPATFSPA